MLHQISSVFICGKKSFLPLIINFQTGSKFNANMKRGNADIGITSFLYALENFPSNKQPANIKSGLSHFKRNFNAKTQRRKDAKNFRMKH